MNVTIYDIILAIPVFTKILSHEFTGKQSFIISRIFRVLNKEIELFNTTREELIKKYAKMDENKELIFDEKGNVILKEDEVENFQNEVNELMYVNIEIDANQIPVEWLDSLKLTPQEMLNLEPFILIE